MASGSIPLLLAANLDDGNMLQAGVVDTFIDESPLMEMMPWVPIVGSVLETREEDQRTSVSFRKVNATYSKTFGTERKHYWGVAIIGGEVFIDNFIINTRGNSIATKAIQYAKVARDAAKILNRYCFDGVGTADDFKGLNALITEGWGTNTAAATNGTTLITAGLDVLDAAIDGIRTGLPDAALLNRTVRRQITSLGRNFSSGYSMIDIGSSAFGHQVTSYNGIPLRIIGDDETGSQILAFDETTGTSSVTSSIYFCKFGDGENLHGLLGAGGMMSVQDFGETEAAPGHLGRIEFYPGLVCANRYSLVRLSGILA